MSKSSTSSEHEPTQSALVEFVHVTVENAEMPNACTMYPRNCARAEMATHWISATEGSFVDLEAAR